ncbi:MAG: phosphoribosyltransferase family protein [Candidatus Pacearchaeota archaeon]
MNCEEIIPLFLAEEIKNIVRDISRRIIKDAIKEGNNKLNFVTVLEGARRFSDELIGEIYCQTCAGFNINNYNIKVSSYCGMTSGKLKLERGIEADLSEKEVIILEDIVDSGKTIQFLADYLLKDKQVSRVKIASLLSKPSRRRVNIQIDYLGKEIPDVFVVGYGLDKDGIYRNLNYIGRVKS